MISHRILCVTQEGLSTEPWLDALKQNFPQVIEMTSTRVLEAQSLANYDMIVVNAVSASNEVAELCKEIRKRSSHPLLVMVPPVDEAFLLELYCVGVSECVIQTLNPALVVAKARAWIRWANSSDAIRQSRMM